MFGWGKKKRVDPSQDDPSKTFGNTDQSIVPDEPLTAGGQGRGKSLEELAMSAELPEPKASDATRVRAGFLNKLARVAGRIPFADDLTAAYYAAVDPKTPVKTKAILFSALAYFILPADTIPDFIVGFGFADDATVLATALSLVAGSIKPEHRSMARELLGLPEPSGR